ncbi:hypothetical protein [Treponema endosymbiont of Eucomonympha sp.]|uniref:hypothetical protein n=1 Tax=Treponema endosymbiont of Eucomonympha sp. TaxID=1580831 RepID=UPI000780AEE2|nr:hypothetical protein [Treponema endosymbiont of Eucomonympha sp.]
MPRGFIAAFKTPGKRAYFAGGGNADTRRGCRFGIVDEHRMRGTAAPLTVRLRSSAVSVRGINARSLGIRAPFHSAKLSFLGISAWFHEIKGSFHGASVSFHNAKPSFHKIKARFHGARALSHETDIWRNALKRAMLAANTAGHSPKGARARRRRASPAAYGQPPA